MTGIWLPVVGGNADALVAGFEMSAADNAFNDTMSPATAALAWHGAAPLRGAYVWNSSAEHANGNPFLSSVAPAITGSTPPVPPPTPTPVPPAPPIAPPPPPPGHHKHRTH